MAEVLMPKKSGNGVEKLESAYRIYSMVKGAKTPGKKEDDEEDENGIKWSDNSNPMVRRMTAASRTA